MSVEKITMPQLGESVTEGIITNWLVSVGDYITKYEPIAEVQTDKVSAEIPSLYTGKIEKIVAKEGETLAVGELLCMIEVAGNEGNEGSEMMQDDKEKEAMTRAEDNSMKTRYSPAVLRLAQENNIDLTQVKGTGMGGRITRKDVQRLIDSGNIPNVNAPAPQPDINIPVSAYTVPPIHETSDVEIPIGAEDVIVPLTPVRKVIAQNMKRSKEEIPHAWMMIEVDVTGLVEYRDSIKDEFKKREGYNITYFAFFVKAIARALKEYPMLNAVWGGDKIIQKSDINLSIAVGTENELYTPVIKNADDMSIKGIARDIADLAHKVRTGKITPDKLQGGTFTVNNTGAFGSIQSMGIINYPQVAILQIESIVKRPVVVNNSMIAIRDMVNLCLSLDHRVLDGIICGRFMRRVKEILEGMSKENLSIH